ncbi:hypothetical protein GJQ54_07480 [Oceanospirillaceae bacterium ASx5O]|nr:hypothetical protein GJQ54_07480 [Oceanospirillaceae bacterium ASx5O]
MPTMILVLLAVGVAILALGALSYIRWREQQRLARAREAVKQADFATSLSSTGELLRPWLSPGLMSFMATAIQFHANALRQLGIPANKAITLALENALLWQQNPSGGKQKLPGSSREAQQLQHAIRHLLGYLRDAYKASRLQASEVRRYLQEARLLNLKISLAVFEDKAGAASKINNHHQAIHFLRKAENLLTQQSELPAELAPVLDDIRTRLQHHEEQRQRSNQGTRLEAGTAALSAEEDAWKKKKFD